MLLQWTGSAKRWQQFKGKGIKNGKVFSLMGPSQGESFWRSFFTSQLIAELPHCGGYSGFRDFVSKRELNLTAINEVFWS